MSSLYLFQFAALIFMLVNALFVALARLNARWKNKRYERSRLMIFLALVLLSAQYYVQMRFHIRATDDHLGAMVNMLVYTPCFGLIAMAIYNLEAVQAKRRNMALACAGFYAAIVGCFALGHYLRGSWHIGGWLYPMLALYSVHMIYCVLMIRKETHKRRRMLETLTATDLLPYVHYSYASVVNLCLAALVTPVAILSTTTLYNYKTGEEIEVNLIDNKNPKGNLIIDCTPLVQNLDRRGSKYFNTERNALVTKEEDLPEIIIEIKLKEPKEIDDILEDDEFDLYLKRNDNGTEIHMNGIEPIAYQYPFNDKNLYPIYEDGEEEDDNYYYSNERLIWGLRVPGNVAHTIEKGDFLKAYKGFAKWAQSGGKNEQNWYNQGNADDNLLIHY